MSADGQYLGQPRTLADAALQRLRAAIISCELEPGSSLPLRELVERLEMSSVPIREALRYLEHSGLVERRPHRGAMVAPVSVEDLEETYAIRVELETMAVRMAAERMTTERARRLEQLLDEYAQAFEGRDPRARELHRELHMAVYGGSESKWLLRLIPMLWDNSERYQRLSLPVRDRSETVEEHRAIIASCSKGDPDATASALHEHLTRTVDAAMAALREENARASGPDAGESSTSGS